MAHGFPIDPYGGPIPGITGPTGAGGPQGDPGNNNANTGAQGPTGPDGLPGSNNTNQGPQGPPGPMGDSPPGDTGPAGMPGMDNSTPGPDGNQGPPGNQGPNGPDGPIINLIPSAPIVQDTTSASTINMQITQSSSGQNGFVSQGDWNTFNNKLNSAYTPGQSSSWNPQPTTIQEALDRIAAALVSPP